MGQANGVSLSYAQTHTNVWSSIRVAFEQLVGGQLTLLGRSYYQGRWTDSSNNSRFAELLSAVRYYAANHMQMGYVAAARIGRGLKELPALRGYSSALTLMWKPFSTYARIVETKPDSQGVIGRIRIMNDYDDWSQLRVLQLLTADASSEEDENTRPNGESRASEGGLSPIPEESIADSDSSRESAGAYLRHESEILQKEIDSIREEFSSIVWR